MAKAVMPVIARIIKGRTATAPKKSAPINVILVKTFPKYSAVDPPGRMPGMEMSQ